MAESGAVHAFAGWLLPFFDGLMFAIGLPGNLVVLRVFSDRQSHRPSHVLLVGLLAADLLVCLCRMVILYLSLAHNSSLQDGLAALRCRISDGSLFFSVCTTMFLLTAVSLDHYAVFCRPIIKLRVTVPKTRFLLALCFLAALALSTATPLFATYELVEESHFCRVTSLRWLSDLRFYFLLGLSAVAFSVNAWLYVGISRAIKHRVRVGNDGRSNRSCLSLISGVTPVRLTVPQISSLMDSPPPALPLRPSAYNQEVAITSQDEPPCCSSSSGSKAANLVSETSSATCHELRDGMAPPKKVRFDDPWSRTDRRSENPLPGLKSSSSSPSSSSPTTSDSNTARMMFAKMLVFSLTWIPVIIFMTLEHFIFSFLDVWLEMCIHLVVVNSALNIVIFAVASRQFRSQSRDLLKAIRCFWEPRFERRRPIHLHHPYWIR
ncbi:uncharacterized protein LOC110977119 [Acanthaster planci]|uniref:Uncharacterized protein LOC110977119 n=1 Tax=Acanthaster planci TaxID=133434 RepID=A0A8B7Y298_ACAPL|nr:uncharacterized protein LOC110977119 [Acanthaster planci]